MKFIKSSPLFEGSFLSLARETYLNDQGFQYDRDIIYHSDAAVILPFSYPDTLYLIKQYRYAAKEVLIEVPAGCLEQGETPEQAASRELKEETGFLAHSFTYFGKAYAMPGSCTECLHFFLAQEWVTGPTFFDQDEQIELVSFSILEVKNMIKKGVIKDAKTLICLFYFFEFLEKKQSLYE